MVFAGRSKLLALIDELVEVPEDDSSRENRPVLVIEGCGGSGRTAVLDKALEKWGGKTPAVLVRPRGLDGDTRSPVRPVLAAIMLGLSTGVPGYQPTFPRVLLAHIAITAHITELDPDLAKAELRTQLNTYRNRLMLHTLISNLLAVGGNLLVNVPASTLSALADHVVAKLQRGSLLTRWTWHKPPLSWFDRPGHDHETELLRLSSQAWSMDDDIRRDVDDVLVAALLADLRHNAARISRRQTNVLVLLDDGDSAAAASFTAAVLRVRRALAAVPGAPGHEQPDPLTLVTTSGGPLSATLDDTLDETPGPARVAGPWLRMPLPGHSHTESAELAKGMSWPFELAISAVACPVYRVARGHPLTTRQLLAKLADEPRLVVDPGIALRRRDPDTGVSVEQTLLHRYIRGLQPSDRLDETLLEALVTVAGARTRQEARALVELLPAPIGTDSVLFTSPTLWSERDAAGGQRMCEPVRYLALRALATRREDERADWATVFRRLRAIADAAGDRTGRLRHSFLLGEDKAVAAELGELLKTEPTAEWLSLLDQVVATPDPRQTPPVPTAADPRGGSVLRLLRLERALKDPCLKNVKAEWQPLRLRAAHDYRELAGDATDLLPLRLRSEEYEKRLDPCEPLA